MSCHPPEKSNLTTLGPADFCYSQQRLTGLSYVMQSINRICDIKQIIASSLNNILDQAASFRCPTNPCSSRCAVQGARSSSSPSRTRLSSGTGTTTSYAELSWSMSLSHGNLSFVDIAPNVHGCPFVAPNPPLGHSWIPGPPGY
jgi:hypothetical protein